MRWQWIGCVAVPLLLGCSSDTTVSVQKSKPLKAVPVATEAVADHQLLLVFADDVDDAEARRTIAATGAKVLHRIPEQHLYQLQLSKEVVVDQQLLKRFQTLPGVRYVEVNRGRRSY